MKHEADGIGLGLIGAGGFGLFCFEQYQTMPQIRLVAVADINTEAAKYAAERLGIESCTSGEELVSRNDIDLVHIATPPSTHATLATLAIQAGKHVLCEKPLATNLDDAKKMIEMAKSKNLTLSVNLIMRYDPLNRMVKEIIDQELLGQPLHGFFENYAQDEGLGPNHWFWNPDISGGIFIEHGVHFFDLFEWWLGEGQVESAQMSRRPNGGMADQVNCTVRYGDEVLVNFYHGFTQANQMDRQEIRLLFEKGTIRLFEWVPTSMEIDCMADNNTIDILAAMLPNPDISVTSHYKADDRWVSSRHKSYEVDGRYLITCNVGMDKPELYNHVVKALLADQIHIIQNPNHQRRITEHNGYESLLMAVNADHLT